MSARSIEMAWSIVRLIVTAAIAFAALSLLYSHGYDLKKDSSTIAFILAGLGGVDGIKRWIATGELITTDHGSDDNN